MEKEKVLEIEITKIDDNYSCYKIKYQNENILKRFKFKDTFKGTILFYVQSLTESSFSVGTDIHSGYKFANFYTKGSNTEADDKPFIIKNEDKKYLQEIVNLLNEKYGIPKRWRAEDGGTYYCISFGGVVIQCVDINYSGDRRDFELGNYFQTKEQAQKVIDSKEWQDFWAKVRAGEIGGNKDVER